MDMDRRGFFKTAGAGAGAAGLALGTAATAQASPLTEKEKLARIASNTWPHPLHLQEPDMASARNPKNEATEEEVWRDHHARLSPVHQGHLPRRDPHGPVLGPVRRRGRRQHVRSRAADGGRGHARDAGVRPLERIGQSAGWKRWRTRWRRPARSASTSPTTLRATSANWTWRSARRASRWPRSGWTAPPFSGAKSMRVNSGGPRIAPVPVATADYPKADELAKYLANCIESFKEMADHGGKVGVKVTLENHWGLTANPINIRIIVDEVNQPVLRGFAGFLQLGARVPDVQRAEGAGALRAHQRPRQVLEPLEGQRRAAFGEDHDWPRVQGHVCAGVRRRARGTESKDRSTSTKKCWRRCRLTSAFPDPIRDYDAQRDGNNCRDHGGLRDALECFRPSRHPA